MTTLAIETATQICGVALIQDGRVIAAEEVDEKNVHAERLVDLITAVLGGPAVFAPLMPLPFRSARAHSPVFGSASAWQRAWSSAPDGAWSGCRRSTH